VDSELGNLMSRKQTGEYDLRSNIKNKPNAQGTLFSGGERTPESRQPRGYSPQRMADVQGYFGLSTRPHVRLHVDGTREVTNAAQMEQTHQLAQTIARSTVPLDGAVRSPLSPATGKPGSETFGPVMNITQNAGHESWAGSYSQPERVRQDYSNEDSDEVHGVINVRPDSVRNSTVIHELGHHADWTGGTMGGNTPPERGRQEAFADNYAQEHGREPGYKRLPANDYVTRRSTGMGWVSSYGYGGDIDRATAFNRGYANERMSPSGAMNQSQFGGKQDALFEFQPATEKTGRRQPWQQEEAPAQQAGSWVNPREHWLNDDLHNLGPAQRLRSA
jgi:hypothetical protein